VNHAGKFAFMFADSVRMPLVIRTPKGGNRGYGATHSQSLERHVDGVPGTQVLCLHHRYSPAELYRALFRTIDRPTLVVENKVLYGQTATSQCRPGFSLSCTDEPFPTVRLAPHVPADITVVAIGGLSLETEQALERLFDEEELLADLFLPTRIYPFSAECLRESLAHTRRLLVVEEGQGFAGLGAEIICQAVEMTGPSGLVTARVAAAPCPIPAARPLEAACLPGVDAILEAAKTLARA
jgi:2-oxoisovalerate dehydrogenase E1 component